MPSRKRKRQRGKRQDPPAVAITPAPARRQRLRMSRRQLILFAAIAVGLIPLQFIVLQRVFDNPPGQVIENVDSELIDDINTPS